MRKRVVAATLFLSLSGAMTGSSQNAVPAPRQQRPIALAGGTVHMVSGPVIERGTISFDNGRITSVGQGGAPAGTDVIDVTEVAFHPESEHIPVGRSGGVTVAAVAPFGGSVSGMAAAMMLEGWTWEKITLWSGVGLVVNWPRMTYAPNPFSRQNKEEWLGIRNRSLNAIRELFEHAWAYGAAKGAGGDTDAGLAAMQPVLTGTTPVIVNASELADMQAALAFAEEQGLCIIISGVRDAWRMTDILRSRIIPVIVRDLQNAGRRWESYDVVFTLPKRLAQAGVPFCIAGDGSGANIRNLGHHAGHASAFGLPREEALRAIPLYPARVVGISDRVGSLEAGKDATPIITDGDPLEVTAKVEQVYIQGRKADMRDKHVRLLDKHRERYRQAGRKR